MGAYDCIWGTSQMLFKQLLGNKHATYCIDLLNSIAIGLYCYDIFLADLNANMFLFPPDQFPLFVLKNCSYIS